MYNSSSTDSIASGSNDEEIYAEEVVEDDGGSELILVPRGEIRVIEWHGGIIIGLRYRNYIQSSDPGGCHQVRVESILLGSYCSLYSNQGYLRHTVLYYYRSLPTFGSQSVVTPLQRIGHRQIS